RLQESGFRLPQRTVESLAEARSLKAEARRLFMPIEDVSKIRNVAILGQGGVGKTSLADALLFAAGKVNRLGRVDDGSSLFDFEPEEIRHKVSISASLHHLHWKKHEVTVVDTPGYANFLSESRQALRAVDGAVVILPPSGQVKIELQRLW